MTSTTLLQSKGLPITSLSDTGAGDVVVLIHGVGMQSAAWTPQITELAKTHRVIALDMPGHGKSAPLPAQAALPDYVDWLYDVCTALDLGPVSLAGHSMGALIAGGFAATYPHLTQRVALLNGVFRRDPAARCAVEARAAEISAGKVDLETPLSRWFGNTPADSQARGRVADWLRTIDQRGYATAYSAFARGDTTYADKFHMIRCPFLALTADGDQNSTPAMAQAMADAVPDGQAIIINGHRHMVNLTAPDRVTSHLITWLSRTPAEPASKQKEQA